MATTAGHSFYIGPIGFFYNQVNDTGSWEPLVFLFIFFVHFLHLQKIALLEEELQKQDYDEDSGTDSPPPGEEQQDSPRDGTRQSRGHRRRRLLPSNVSVRQEEV